MRLRGERPRGSGLLHRGGGPVAPGSRAPGCRAPRCAVAKNEWNRGVTTDSFDRSGPAGHHYYRPRYEERDRRGAGTRGNGSDREVLCSEEFQPVIGSSREQALPALSGQIQLVPSVDLSLPHHMKSLVEEFLCMRCEHDCAHDAVSVALNLTSMRSSR